MYIGIDDTDSPEKYCTTYIATLLVENLRNRGYTVEMPKLIRMNPMVKYKTRGNGGISIHILDDLCQTDKEEIKDTVLKFVEKYSDFKCDNTNPGIVFLDDKKYNENREKLAYYYKKVLYDIITVEYAEKFILKVGGEFIKYNVGRGIIGAFGAISSTPPYTYELLTYRKKEMWGKPRYVDRESVISMDKCTFPYTYDNYDYENDKILITPNTPCPVLFGIRGIKVGVLIDAMHMVKGEKPDKFMVFKTNHGTDVHLRKMNVKDIYPNTGVIVCGKVIKDPRNIEGGHVVFNLSDNTGEISCIAYEPTKSFRDIIRKLKVGDYISVYGTVREDPLGINIEKIKILKLEKIYVKDKKCPYCGGTLKSKGRRSGYKCKKCGKVIEYDKIRRLEVKRDIRVGFYEVPGSARRHLSKPIQLIDVV